MHAEGTTILTESHSAVQKQRDSQFEKQYISLRNREGRLFTDEDLQQLPTVTKIHPYYKEWEMRKKSATALTTYLSQKKQLLKILEVGCGNGWLSNKLSTIPGSNITGLDINTTELEQADRVFGNTTNLLFIAGDIRYTSWGNKKFDCILFAASIQYFSSLQLIISRSIELLNDNGEIHIIDSPFYEQRELTSAKERSDIHFQQTGFPEMAIHYFHHCWDEVALFRHKVVYKPSYFQKYILQKRNPFPWICIKK